MDDVNNGSQGDLPGDEDGGEGDARPATRRQPGLRRPGATFDFYPKVFNRNSVDGRGMRLDSRVHYETDYDNALWNGRQMVYGDGDGLVFKPASPPALDVIAHELTHGVTQFAADLRLPGPDRRPERAHLRRLRHHGQAVHAGPDRRASPTGSSVPACSAPASTASAIRSMAAPGTAYDDPVLGTRPAARRTCADYVRPRRRQRRRPHQLRHPQPRLLPRSHRARREDVGGAGADLVHRADHAAERKLGVPGRRRCHRRRRR